MTKLRPNIYFELFVLFFVQLSKNQRNPKIKKQKQTQKHNNILIFKKIKKMKIEETACQPTGPFTTVRGSGGGSPRENALRAECQVKNSTLGMGGGSIPWGSLRGPSWKSTPWGGILHGLGNLINLYCIGLTADAADPI